MLGKVISVRAHWGEYLPNWHPWEDYKQGYAARTDLGGGVVLTLSHPLDYLRWLLGDVDTLWAYIGNQGLGMPVEDTAEIGLRFHSGVLGSLHLDYVQRPPTHILELVGTHGTIYWDNADGIARLARVGGPDADSDPDHLDQQLASIHSKAGPWEAFSPPEGFERNWLFLDELRHFMSVIRGEATPACTLDDGIQALRLSLAVHQSACLGQMIKF